MWSLKVDIIHHRHLHIDFLNTLGLLIDISYVYLFFTFNTTTNHAHVSKIYCNNTFMIQTTNNIRCGPCQMVAPHFEAMSNEYSNAIFVKVDVDAQDKIAQNCGVRAMPTFQFFKDGAKVDELMGANVAALKAKVSALA